MKNSYTNTRLAQYGITDELNSTTVRQAAGPGQPETEAPAKWFQEYNPSESDKLPNELLTGSIQFLYKTLEGYQRQYKREGQGWSKNYHIYRLHPDKVTRGNKYFQPKGSGSHIYHTPGIIESYRNQEKIETLYLVEGPLKAFTAWMHGYTPGQPKQGKKKAIPATHGIHIMGIMGISQAGDAEYNREKKEAKGLDTIIAGKRLHEDILEYIRVCRPDNLCVLFDADCLQMAEWDPEKQPDKDLGKRFQDFFFAIKDIREFAKDYVKDVYFMHVDEKYLTSHIPGTDEKVKGLDDLLLYKKDDPALVIADMKRLQGARAFFECINIKTEGIAKIKNYFLLGQSKGVPLNFYLKFERIIQSNEFVWCKGKYQYTPDGLQMKQHKDSSKFVRIGCNYMKVVYVPNSKGVFERRLEPWRQGEITRDYVDKGVKNFFDTIEKYDAPCNVPEHDPEKYQQSIIGPAGDRTYNLYYIIDHKIEQGPWAKTEGYLKHIFQDKYDVALDYLYLLYHRPTQMQPIICLVSKEKNTGKSTFLWWLRELFKENVTVIGNKEIHDAFNDDYASKLVIGIDEGLFDKQIVIERIKSQSTSPRIKMNTKFMSRQEISFIGKFIITSNNEDTFIKIDDDEARFFVNKVPKFEKTDPELLDKMVLEIPAFLHYIKHTHKLKYTTSSRHWFAPEDLETSALRSLKKESKTWGTHAIEGFVRTEFLKYQAVELHYTCEELLTAINGPNAPKKDHAYFLKCLKNELKLESRFWRAYKPELNEVMMPGLSETFSVSESKGKPGAYYTFLLENLLGPGEYGHYISMAQLEEIRARQASWPALRELKIPDPPNITIIPGSD